MRYDNTMVHTVKRHYNETNDGVEDFNDTQQNTHNSQYLYTIYIQN